MAITPNNISVEFGGEVSYTLPTPDVALAESIEYLNLVLLAIVVITLTITITKSKNKKEIFGKLIIKEFVLLVLSNSLILFRRSSVWVNLDVTLLYITPSIIAFIITIIMIIVPIKELIKQNKNI